MNPVRYTQTGTGAGRAVNMDYNQNPFNVGIGCVVSGTVTYNVEHTFDNIYAGNPAIWMLNSNVNGTTVTAATNYAFPVTAVRLNVTGGSGSVAITIIQATNSP